MIPSRQPGQSFEDHQADMARWMGVSVTAMNQWHDRTHEALCRLFGLPSQSLRHARGEDMTPRDYHFAGLEEQAALHVQRWVMQAGGKLP